MIYLFAALYLADIALQMYACARKDHLLLRRITKCFLMPLLALFYAQFAKTVSPLVISAILSGFVGDVVLLLRPRKFAFPAGILAFAAGHVFYVIRFLSAIPTLPDWYIFAILGLICITAALTLLHYLWKGLPKKLRPPSLVYMLIIGAMASCSILFALYGTSDYRWLAAIGGLLFVLSDTTLSIDAFHHPVRYRNVIVMATYIAAQTLIVLALSFV